MKNSGLFRLLFVVAFVLRILPCALYADTLKVVGHNDPIADPRAVVIAGSARFTVLTPYLIRMEWSADGKFEDHASLVFLNRELPVPEFTHEAAPWGTVIRTSA